jgi:plasmid replication initiation protein
MPHLRGETRPLRQPILSSSSKSAMPNPMGQKVEGGIEKHQDLKRFTASASDIAAKDQIDLMSRCWFSLTPNRSDPIEHQFVNLKTKLSETVRITGSSEHGIATVHDQDLIIFTISQWIEAKRLGLEPTRRICFTPYQFFTWTNKVPNGKAYQRLKDALHRLKTTNIETTIRAGNNRRDRVKQFSWISEWETTEKDGNVQGVEVVLAEWLFESIQDFHVLTVDKRYFEIPGSVERWLYLYARKATGGENGIWKESFKSLHKKSASQQAYKHYASALRKLVEKNELPGLNLSRKASAAGEDMLVMERTEKREPKAPTADVPNRETQLLLIEQTPLEEAWENAFEILGKQLGVPTANSWLKPLQLVGCENGVVTFSAPTKFIADWVESHYKPRLLAVWQSLGYEVASVRIDTKPAKSAA